MVSSARSELRMRVLTAVSAAALWLANAAGAADWTVKMASREPPKELDPAIRATLQSQAVQLLEEGKVAYEIWFVTELPATAKPSSPSKALDTLKQATLLGAVSVPSDRRDYRDDALPAGVYTARFALQPQDGNHSGTSDFVYFAVLIPAKFDPRPDGIKEYKPMVKASSRETSNDHPMILSLRPVASADGELPRIEDPAPEHKAVRVQVPAQAGGDKTSLVFDLVFEGMVKK